MGVGAFNRVLELQCKNICAVGINCKKKGEEMDIIDDSIQTNAGIV